MVHDSNDPPSNNRVIQISNTTYNTTNRKPSHR